jgi:hypothetical protein
MGMAISVVYSDSSSWRRFFSNQKVLAVVKGDLAIGSLALVSLASIENNYSVNRVPGSLVKVADTRSAWDFSPIPRIKAWVPLERHQLVPRVDRIFLGTGFIATAAEVGAVFIPLAVDVSTYLPLVPNTILFDGVARTIRCDAAGELGTGVPSAL